MIQDARTRSKVLGNIDAIFVGGDIAFAGKTEEYASALVWLHELADACGCKRARIYVIPGNHDIDRNLISSDISVQNAQQAVIGAVDKEWALNRQLMHAETGPALLRPLAAYNEFAAPFSCAVFAPERVFWHADLPFDGVTLRVYGLNSTLLSGARSPNGENDIERDLYLGAQQTVLDPVDNVVNLVMCHHPPDWLFDGDRVADDINGRGAIHLFGHKHRQRIVRDPRYVTFFAGAVNPDRQERDWKPGYNIIELSIETSDIGQLQLSVAAHLLEWQSSPEGFRPIIDDDCDIHHAKVRLRNINPEAPQKVASDCVVTIDVAVLSDGTETAMADERTRSIVLRFWNLDMSDRREISRTLKLIEPGENTLPPAERFGRALIRAGERGMLESLSNEIEKREKH